MVDDFVMYYVRAVECCMLHLTPPAGVVRCISNKNPRARSKLLTPLTDEKIHHDTPEVVE